MQTSHRTTLMLRAKVVVVGDACVGKTSVVQMFKSGGHDYPKNYIMVSWASCFCDFIDGLPYIEFFGVCTGHLDIKRAACRLELRLCIFFTSETDPRSV